MEITGLGDAELFAAGIALAVFLSQYRTCTYPDRSEFSLFGVDWAMRFALASGAID
ncbi:MAG: hypothetical protein HC851_23950 [Acaryochloris sp. RU_4_1]|nr:hypothetical protein [Acaryochloris sp. RU_4_1]